MFLLVFEFLSTQELLLILVAALVLFGPRKLPQLARSIGKTLAEFKSASEGFKDQWEREVERETAGIKEVVADINASPAWDNSAVLQKPNTIMPETPAPIVVPEPLAVPEPLVVAEPLAVPPPVVVAPPAPLTKRDWL